MMQTENKPELIFVIGLCGSGKSTFVESLAKTIDNDVAVFNSDDVRKQITGDVHDHSQNKKVFECIYLATKGLLEEGTTVIIDAAVFSRKKRMKALERFPNYKKTVWYMDTPLDVCLSRNAQRDRNVPEDMIYSMWKKFEIPIRAEGWDMIHFVHHGWWMATEAIYDYWDMTLRRENYEYEKLFELLNVHNEFKQIWEMPQDSPYHSLTVSEHTYRVFTGLKEMGFGTDMLWAGLLHDIGKPYTKEFRNGKTYANYIGHENVSAQLAIHFLHKLGYDDNFIMNVAEVISLHMKMHTCKTFKDIDNLESLYGYELTEKLIDFFTADKGGK